jgi:hypothetical protein
LEAPALKEIAMIRLVFAMLAVVLISPAAAEYFIVRDSSNQCSVVERLPRDMETVTLLGDGASNDRAYAEKEMKAMWECSQRAEATRPFAVAAAEATGATKTAEAAYFIVRDSETNRCDVLEHPPGDPERATLLGDGAYNDRASAETDMRAIAACQTQAAAGAPQGASASTPR